MTNTRPELTKRQQVVYDYILKTYKETGYFPSVREIRDGVGVSSTATVQSHLMKLVEKGYIERAGSKSRTLRILHDMDRIQHSPEYDMEEVVPVPLVGAVAAGIPITADENREDTIPLPASMVKGESFMLRVKGDSMINAGIFDGDLVIVRVQNTAENGDIVVAMIEDEATVKTFYREAEGIRLQPENDALEPIITRDVTIAGKVIALMRSIA
ncbi:MAG: transcriptional repressor LexA [Coriobacteriia bacterium]|nr:transcriptional repressor LexA [Coriobacteriia bacterium]MCL2746952.1 transcriptional repressor LexA [Coriobacteriia bacterium]MCL2870887.1 transcriptional repressor LexA [Coriobacteriia bacterium]